MKYVLKLTKFASLSIGKQKSYSWVTQMATFPEGRESIKWGLRGRAVLKGYDLTLNYVRELKIDFMETIISASQRIGFTAKGDLGPLGAYGALGYYFESGSKIYLQLEYLSIKEKNLSSILAFLLPKAVVI